MSTTTSAYLAEGTLSHGLRVAVRPMAPGDRADLVDGFHRLSDESRYTRFMCSKPRLSAAEARHLFDTDELALVLVWPRTSCKDIVLGIAHAMRVPGQPHTAEFCIAIADEIHGRGAGRLMTQTLAAEASRRGIDHLTGYMLATNQAPAKLLAGVGDVVHDQMSAGTREMTVRLAHTG
jgi:L-amino acid N-acyltransferase YncA